MAKDSINRKWEDIKKSENYRTIRRYKFHVNKQNSIIEISEIKNQDLVDKYSKIKGKRLISKDEYFLGCKDCVNRNIKGPSDFSIDNRNNSYLFAILKNLK